MNPSLRILATTIIFILMASFIAYDYFHEGVPTHYLLHSDSMPGFSNYWGLLLMPLLTWLLSSYMITHKDKYGREISIPFIAALVFGMAISLFFALEIDLPGYLMLGTFALALFLPLYRPSYYMGFAWGMCFTFGGVIPVIVGGILMLIYFVIHQWVRKAILYLWYKIR